MLKLERQERLRTSRQFRETYIRGLRLHGPHLSIFYRANDLAYSRLGLSVGKKQFKLSVERHYIQRLLRQAYRLNKDKFSPGYDIVVRANRLSSSNRLFRTLEKELCQLVSRAQLRQVTK